MLKEKIIRVSYDIDFVFDFSYQIATNKKEAIDMFLNLKRQVEYEINIRKDLKELHQ